MYPIDLPGEKPFSCHTAFYVGGGGGSWWEKVENERKPSDLVIDEAYKFLPEQIRVLFCGGGLNMEMR